ncbi:acyl-CoA dehydrogenase family protein [Parapusillimonas granuli]|uniref:Acyl-CoA/acyl-ACP dehydrogenase n=1 Tax=Parapusillimonas granuli TaxID=380911 RepID=A0A853FPY0_9BURK|nr:alkylation response protein AidB-like acyl-CoA dehydrogenase [Parapusillimonas granuli]MEB2400440.1 acyl-CoA/acyl-ACP dehydrogenase [Alcaligenaceae bacterium]NYT47844.1 acyl-CoA/acyl-ACP dehydrogenase [Parapusillimonas granuli]
MNFELTQDQEAMVSAVQRVSRDAIEPIMASHPVSAPLPKEAMLRIYAHLAELGITAPRLPEEAGGGGLKMLDYGMLIEQLPPVVALSLISHEGTISRIHAGCPREIRDAYLPDLIAGRKIACTANSEADAGSDSNAVKTRLEIDGDHAYITGRKMWITNASICDVVNVSCTAGAGPGGKPLTRRVLVDRSQSDFEVRETPVTGLQQGHLSEIEFDRSRVPLSHVLGEPGDAGKYLTLAWNANRPLLGLMTVHLAQRALDMTREYVGLRKQFGKTLGAHQLVQQDLSDIETRVMSARLMCYYALSCMDRGLRANGTSAMAKRYATHACERAINLAMQLHGAMGITQELPLERMWRDARMFQVPDGTMGILALIHGRELTGIGAFR